MNDVSVIAYFADDPTRTYQLIQWLPVLDLLHAQHPVGIVARDPESATLLGARTSLPVFAAPSFPELTDLYAELDAKVVLYCNNSILNFQSLLGGRMLHVHVNHGESDKHCMASNNAKAYDRVFVAGEAAVQRHAAGLLEFDIAGWSGPGGRSWTCAGAGAARARGGRSSTRRPGRATRSTTTTPPSTHRRRHRPRRPGCARRPVRLQAAPEVVSSRKPAVRAANRRIVGLVDQAIRREPDAGHQAITRGDILAIFPDCDLMVTDVSTVGLDLLYLRPDCRCSSPTVTTTPTDCAGRAGQACADVITDVIVDGLDATIAARLEQDEHHLARVAMRHHYFDDLQVGDSTVRFLDAVSETVPLRDRLLGAAT